MSSRSVVSKGISGEGLSAAEQYALREEREHKNTGDYTDKPGQQFENGDFAYAPANATYVEMSGTLSYKDDKGNTVNADVTFTVHLGYADGNPNDYDTRRIDGLVESCLHAPCHGWNHASVYRNELAVVVCIQLVQPILTEYHVAFVAGPLFVLLPIGQSGKYRYP